jgi:hypothetical protein
MIPSTVVRVPRYAAEPINQQIRRQTEKNIARYASAGPAPIERRLEELDREWDIERTLEANAATALLVGVGLGPGFLLQHALQGWCPPLPIVRRLGVRTQSEIEAERCALKALGGDFRNATDSASAHAAARAALEGLPS